MIETEENVKWCSDGRCRNREGRAAYALKGDRTCPASAPPSPEPGYPLSAHPSG
jgi:hypothetical protein